MSHGKTAAQAENDTICAEATPRGRGGISVIRVSGPNAVNVVSSLFDRQFPPPGTFRFGRIVSDEPDPVTLDDVVISYFGAPHSYTGEDVVEISLHGSPVVVADVLEAIYAKGARPANPGEFTLRAYLNGQIDLTQAEAVADLINASSSDSARAALAQLEGGIGRAAEEIAVLIERLLVYAELELDFVEEDVQLASRNEKLALVDMAIESSKEMMSGYRLSRRLREGVKVVLTGAPNVGKSSIYNALIGEDKAIVHAAPGTTRDVLSAKIIVGGIEFELFDTAGIREAGGDVEDQGIARALQAAESADIVIEIDSVDLPSLRTPSAFRNIIYATNKCDIKMPQTSDCIALSARKNIGIDALKLKLLGIVTDDAKLTDGTISRERHFIALGRGLEALQRGRVALIENLPDEMVAEEWREAMDALDELTGKHRLDELLNTIFGKFCIGK